MNLWICTEIWIVVNSMIGSYKTLFWCHRMKSGSRVSGRVMANGIVPNLIEGVHCVALSPVQNHSVITAP